MTNQELVSLFSRLYQSQSSIRALYFSAGIDSSKLPVLDFPLSPYEYWEKVILILSAEDLDKIISAASKSYPGNASLKMEVEKEKRHILVFAGGQFFPLETCEVYVSSKKYPDPNEPINNYALDSMDLEKLITEIRLEVFRNRTK